MAAGFLALLLLIALLVLVLRRNGGSAAEAQRLQTLEAQVAWLYRESQRLRAELAALKGDASPAPLPAADPGEGRAEAFVDETPTQPGADLEQAAAAAVGAEAAANWWQRLLAGNILAKIGVVLLFFGVASALRLAADYGYLPVQLRLLLGAVGGVAMIAFGWARFRQGAHQAFGIALQGGGFAILYLIVYFMLARYALLGATPSFILFAVLGVACVLLAAAQDGVVLAVFGLAGAFFAPVLAASGSGDPLPLFAYFTLLNAFIVGVSWFKAWRALNVAGFFLTIGVGMAWAVEHYHAGHYAVTQGFLLFFWLLYSATPVLMAWFRAPGRAGWSDATLVFGTPLVGFALQSQLSGDRYELAWAALAAALYYAALWSVLFKRGSAEMRLVERSQLGLAIAFGTLAVPLAFGVQVTSAFWALEGVAVLWFGVAQGRRLAMATGGLLQMAGGGYFLSGLQEMRAALPIVNDIWLGMFLLAAAGFASARLLARGGGAACVPALGWALAWWLGAGLHEIDRFASPLSEVELTLLFLVLTLLAADQYGRASDWLPARQAAALPAGLLLLWALWSNFEHAGATGGLPYLPVLNPFDFVQLGALWALHRWLAGLAAEPRPGMPRPGWVGGLAFVWLSGLAARIAHHWGGVPFDAHALWHSTLLQAMLTFSWTLLAIAAMIRAAHIGQRRLWQGGFALLAVIGVKLLAVDLANAGTLLWTASLIGVALLVLAASYFAPMPPGGSAPVPDGERG